MPDDKFAKSCEHALDGFDADVVERAIERHKPMTQTQHTQRLTKLFQFHQGPEEKYKRYHITTEDYHKTVAYMPLLPFDEPVSEQYEDTTKRFIAAYNATLGLTVEQLERLDVAELVESLEVSQTILKKIHSIKTAPEPYSKQAIGSLVEAIERNTQALAKLEGRG